MNRIEKSVSLHPYFLVNPGRMAEVKALLREFVARSAEESGSLYYEFTINGDTVFCRESYISAEAVLTHLTNVDDLLQRMLTLATVSRVEVHGPAAELDKLRGPLGGLNPGWFAYECGVVK
jgi:quinol monooxygenase YgiN